MIKKTLRSLREILRGRSELYSETTLLLLGKQMSWRVASLPPNTDFRKVGFKVFSQFDEDGIIQYLISKVPIENKTFIEFGVEDYRESNTRFLLINDHWQGMVMDASADDIRHIQRDKIHWQYDLQTQRTWITRENVDALMRASGFAEDAGLVSIDIDGNDYWIWEAIESVKPRIVIIEYNSLLGLKPIVVPYQEKFQRTAAHFSNLYYGASLGALYALAQKKGYILVGSNIWGHNAFFVRADAASGLVGLDPQQVYVASKFRESRNAKGKLTYLRGQDRKKMIENLPVVNVSTGEKGSFREMS